jgi:hypothetical protein
MEASGLSVSDDRSPAAWIAPRLGGRFGAVARFVPRGYSAYVRVCHAATDQDGRRVTWSEVAESTGRQAHPLMQWHSLVGSADPLDVTSSSWRGSNPQRGNLEPDVLAALCGLLGDHTSKPDDCFFCLWDGYGWIDRAPKTLPPAFSPAELSRPRVELPGRSYLLLAGPVTAAGRIAPQSSFRQSPNLFWPADHTWCVATELDFDSTLLGGTTDLIETILDTSILDAWPIGPDDSLAADADLIN